MESDDERANWHWWFRIYRGWLDRLPDLSRKDPMTAAMMFSACHGERCAICFQKDERRVEDHDHRTGLVRGLLCRGCNAMAPSDIDHCPHRWYGRKAVYAYYCQYPPAAAANYRSMYMSAVGEHPAPDLPDRLWIVTADGPERLLDAPDGTSFRYTVVTSGQPDPSTYDPQPDGFMKWWLLEGGREAMRKHWPVAA